MKEGSIFRAADDSNPEASWFRGFLTRNTRKMSRITLGKKAHESHQGHEFFFVLFVSMVDSLRSLLTGVDLRPEDGQLL
jgi:hypothetical protein